MAKTVPEDDKAPREPGSAGGRAGRAIVHGARTSVGTIWFLLRIMVPVSLLVALLGWSGALEVIAHYLKPLMGFIGLPGEAALVFISALLLNIYSAIAVAGSLALDMRHVTILAIMCLTAHNLIVETAVMKKAGSSAIKMPLLRLGSAIFAGWLYNLILPQAFSSMPFSTTAALGARLPLPDLLASWGLSTGRLVLKISLIVLAIMIIQRLLEEFKIMDLLSKLLSPFMKLFGLPEKASFLWIVVNVVGYAYGAGIIVEQIESGRMKPQEGDLLNHSASLCHSILEDSALFVGVGLSLFWITVPRLVMAVVAVWLERLRRYFVRRSFRVGTN
jgi:spore maturation protein SpmB